MLIAARESFAAAASRRRLPYDSRVEYLQSSGSASNGPRINTGILIPLGCNLVEYQIKFMFTQNQKGVLCGHQSAAHGNPRTYLYYTPSGSTQRQFYVGNLINTSLQVSANTVVESRVVLDGASNTLTIYHGNTLVLSKATSGTFLNRDYPIRFFGGSYGRLNDDSTSARIWYFRILHSNMLVRDFVPVRKDGVGYMFDRVSGQLFANAGTGSFVIGPDLAGGGVNG